MNLRCEAISKSGSQCVHANSTVAQTAAGPRCLFHDPTRQAELLVMRKNSQAASTAAREQALRDRMASLSDGLGARPAVGNSLEEIGTFLRHCIESHVRGQLDRGDLTALTNSARLLQTIYENRDIEKQLKTAQRELVKLKAASR